MKSLQFWFDPVSPYAYLAFERLPEVLAGSSCAVSYRPVLLAGLLQHWGQLGPAEIAPKRDWTYRQVAWLAQRLDIPLVMPAQHPFNPLALSRLLLAHGRTTGMAGSANRFACETVLRRVWRTGEAAGEAAQLQALAEALAPGQAQSLLAALREQEVKALLRANTEQAVSAGIFGVPTVVVEDKAFWGLDGLDMLVAYLRGDAWFDGPAWEAAARVPLGLPRRAGALRS
ncbi:MULTISPECIES: 2-hydroxychromene-2-carboxylate isomerase [Caldimonas]|jgi:2-hydroxychromene-2-carboxylate isomerase|uniref:2-hydroxychromene-2-carboxylate isomerase n=1 Tax=Caldimonas TaxID=196013 RepID=UPI00037476EF|nr:2-hydroxychromene-2-carboxylate isomerase [Caldimonas manganoxidans]MCX7659205.1 2-hydroxychromene-2-carboxylate isomerase [Caldimonas manganoxidans]GIX23039.1 MAG: isomerase [Caldimonas sp.]